MLLISIPCPRVLGLDSIHEAGVIFTTGLSGQKARVKLSVLLSAHANRETIIRAFQV